MCNVLVPSIFYITYGAPHTAQSASVHRLGTPCPPSVSFRLLELFGTTTTTPSWILTCLDAFAFVCLLYVCSTYTRLEYIRSTAWKYVLPVGRCTQIQPSLNVQWTWTWWAVVSARVTRDASHIGGYVLFELKNL